MGKNYYCVEPPCPCCKRDGERLHIGKSSAGWVFALHIHPDRGLHSLEYWEQFWADKQIEDEYGSAVNPERMRAVICDRKRPEISGSAFVPQRDDLWFRENGAICGPNGLARSKVDGRHCIAHGNGTYDFHIGDFS